MLYIILGEDLASAAPGSRVQALALRDLHKAF